MCVHVVCCLPLPFSVLFLLLFFWFVCLFMTGSHCVVLVWNSESYLHLSLSASRRLGLKAFATMTEIIKFSTLYFGKDGPKLPKQALNLGPSCLSLLSSLGLLLLL